MPEYRTCRNCNGTGHLPVWLAFAGICSQCIGGQVRVDETTEPGGSTP